MTLRTDNSALSWLKTYSLNEGIIGRWCISLDQYDMHIQHRTRTKHENAKGFFERTNHYILRTTEIAPHGQQENRMPIFTGAIQFITVA